MNKQEIIEKIERIGEIVDIIAYNRKVKVETAYRLFRVRSQLLDVGIDLKYYEGED